MKKIYLVLEDGQAFEGYSFGAEAAAVGELVFQTGMVGYIETLTDPAYYGQIILQTFPMIGNYGIIPADFDGKCGACGYVVSEWCETPSNFRCEYTIDKFLKDQGIPGIYGVDTRELTKILRDNGTLNATICDKIPEDLTSLKEYRIINAVAEMTCDAPKTIEAKGEKKLELTVVDYGMRAYLAEEMAKRGCRVTVVPANTSAEEILASSPDGVLLSGGPGDPAENEAYISNVEKLMGKVPMLGVAFGHQLMALASGAKTYKLAYGHRGGNQPVKMIGTDRTFITSQNHGYAVDSASVVKGNVIFMNANDESCEGIEYKAEKAFSVQFYPESNSGAHSTSFVFDKFAEMMGGEN